jgi:predicted Rossmann-fold nucleotide-binding protein
VPAPPCRQQLGYHAKPVGLLNVAGFFDHLLDFFDHATEAVRDLQLPRDGAVPMWLNCHYPWARRGSSGRRAEPSC